MCEGRVGFEADSAVVARMCNIGVARRNGNLLVIYRDSVRCESERIAANHYRSGRGVARGSHTCKTCAGRMWSGGAREHYAKLPRTKVPTSKQDQRF